MAAINLYDDQQEFVHKLRQSLATGHKSILGVASPAFGKTVVAAYITAAAREKRPDSSVWFLVHRKNLLRQTSKSFWSSRIEHGLITSGKARSKMPIQIGTIGTVHRRLETLSAPAIVFIDEAHLSHGSMFKAVIEWALAAGSIVIGLTGTPQRLDGRALGDLYKDMIEARSTRWLIEQGRLSEYVAYTTPMSPPIDSVSKQAGDYAVRELAEIMDRPTITGDAVAHWKKYASGLRTVVYCVNVEHSKHTAAAFCAAGVPAIHLDGTSTEDEIKEACEGLASGRYLVMTNCELVIEGFDLSAQVGRDVTLECCILLRPTMSLARYLQMVFRALRKKPRPAVILDHAGCMLRHGLPCDIRQWSLAGREKGKGKKKQEDPEVKIQQCQKCWAVFRPPVDCCPRCGAPVQRIERKIEVTDGELEQIDVAALRLASRKEQGHARGLRDLIELGIRRGMKKPGAWAVQVYAARHAGSDKRELYNQATKIEREIKR